MSKTYKYKLPLQTKFCTEPEMIKLLNSFISTLNPDEEAFFTESQLPGFAGKTIEITDDEGNKLSRNICLGVDFEGDGQYLKQKSMLFCIFTTKNDKAVSKETVCINFSEETLIDSFEEYSTLLCESDFGTIIDNIQPEFLKFAFKKRIVGKAYDFRIPRNAVHLRLEDAEKIEKMFEGKSGEKYKALLIRSEKGKISPLLDKLTGIVSIMYIDDEDLIEELDEHVMSSEDDEKMWFFIGDHFSEMDYTEENIEQIAVLAYSTYDGDCDSVVPEIYLSQLASNYLSDSEAEKMSMSKEMSDVNKTLKQMKKAINQSANMASRAPIAYAKPDLKPGTPLIVAGDKEKDLYAGEIRDIIIDCLQQYRKNNTMEDSRRAHILDDILEKNKPSGALEEKKNDVIEALTCYDGTSPRNITNLKKAGFKVKSTNKHIKAMWQEDERYMNTLPTTPGDAACGNENMIHKVINKCF